MARESNVLTFCPLLVSNRDGGRSSGTGIFIGGFVLGGIVMGTLGCVYAPQVTLSETDITVLLS